MIPLDKMELTTHEAEELLRWSAIFFENGVRLMSLANFVHETTAHKETLAHFLQEKVKVVLLAYESDAGFECEKKHISESAQRMILSMLEMIKIEGGVCEDSEVQ